MSRKIEEILPVYVDSSMMDAFKLCPRKFYHSYILGLRSYDQSVHLVAGGAFADALQAFYNSYFKEKDWEAAKILAMRAFFKKWDKFPWEPPGKSQKNIFSMWEAVEKYLQEYPPDEDSLQPYFIEGNPGMEVTFALELPVSEGFPLHPVTKEPFLYAGRMDFLGIENGDEIVPRDEKTTGSFGTTWYSSWDLRSQFIGYKWVLERYGYKVSKTLVRGIAILKSEIRFQEVYVPIGNHLVERWYFQLKRDLNRLVDCWNEGYFDYNLGSACNTYSGCEYRDLCKVADPKGYYSNFNVKRWNPLNSNPEEAEKNDDTVEASTREFPDQGDELGNSDEADSSLPG